MGLFRTKRKVTTERFCLEFYSGHVFAKPIRGLDPHLVWSQTVHKQITSTDTVFKQVDLDEFSFELRALRLEVFALAWIHRVDQRLTLVQSQFTKDYLYQNGLSDLWETMGAYNTAIARSTVGGSDPNTRSGRSKITYLNLSRVNMFEEWSGKDFDDDCIARVANCLGSKSAWKSTRVHTYLSFALTDRLGCEISREARKGLLALVKGYYDGAKELLQKVTVVFA